MLGLVVFLLVAGLQFGDAYDCCQVKQRSSAAQTGIYEIDDVCGPALRFTILTKTRMHARCDMDTNGGGWLVIQRRVSGGTENFYRPWEEYEDGFGNLNREFWYGLKNIHCLTNYQDVELKIELKRDDETGITWTYQVFKVEGPDTNYILRIGEGQGTNSHDAMAVHNNRPFTTYDQDHDANGGYNCAQSFKGAWWYGDCYPNGANLNGPHVETKTYDQIRWYDGSTYVYFPNVEMKIRPKACLST